MTMTRQGARATRVGDLDRVVDVDEIGNADEQREDTAGGS